MHPFSFAKTGAGAGATTICDVPHLGSFLGAFGEGVGCVGDKADSRKCPCHLLFDINHGFLQCLQWSVNLTVKQQGADLLHSESWLSSFAEMDLQVLLFSLSFQFCHSEGFFFFGSDPNAFKVRLRSCFI